MPDRKPSPDAVTELRRPEDTPTVVTGGAPVPPTQFTPGHVLGGRYRIVSCIGRGGMGEVYRADDLKIGHAVALKFLRHSGHAQRLYQEVRIGREISHPNVCRLYDAAEVDGKLFITMEFIDGEDLASLLRRVGRLPSEKALAVARDICAGVAAAHEKGVIHRDLKPANVMIDGRGRARVTDFGLAVAGEQATDNSGTLAYMAPEQLEGESASVGSDIYALGLILYEIFTGRRTFESASVHDLLIRQKGGNYARPSSITRDVPPTAERIISRCLDPDPRARPRSVDELLRELPGGDPLAAAIAAGETPTPAMVAAASRQGDLSIAAAWTVFALAVAGYMAGAAISDRTMLRDVAGMKAPDALRESARQILAQAGLVEPPGDSDLFVVYGPSVVYRQSRSALRPFNAHGTLQTFDPPLDVVRGSIARNPGMATVQLHPDGRLLRFFIVPPTMEKGTAADPNWDPFLIAAGYDPRRVTRTEPEWASRVDSDRKAAWLTRDGRRIEAAAYHGRPVSFEVLTPRAIEDATAVTTSSSSQPARLAALMQVIFMLAIPMAAIVLARANLRSHRGDRAGALRAAGCFFVLMLIGLSARAHHPMRFTDEWMMVSWHVAQATFWALNVALMYIALEPFVRRRWPEILISWTRLLSGRWNDPMVGRDVLVGAAGAGVVNLVWQSTLVVGGVTSPLFAATLGPPRFVVSAISLTLAESLLRSIGLVVLLVMLRAVFRADMAATLLATLLVATMTLGDTLGPLWLRAYYAIPAAFAGVLLARHFGLLAVSSYAFFVLTQHRLPLTFDAGAWYFGRSAVVLLLLTAIVAYAFRLSVGSKRWLPRMALE